MNFTRLPPTTGSSSNSGNHRSKRGVLRTRDTRTGRGYNTGSSPTTTRRAQYSTATHDSEVHPYARRTNRTTTSNRSESSSGSTLSLSSITKAITRAIGDLWKFGKGDRENIKERDRSNRGTQISTPHYLGESPFGTIDRSSQQQKKVRWKDNSEPKPFDMPLSEVIEPTKPAAIKPPEQISVCIVVDRYSLERILLTKVD
jgi:hypothetical protein